MICSWCNHNILSNEAYVCLPPGIHDHQPTFSHLSCFNNTGTQAPDLMRLRIVKATREGLVGRRTATGHVIQRDSWFVALPSTKALRRIVEVWNCSMTERHSLIAPVLDVGPWNERDDPYVLRGEKPSAESGTDTRGRKTNGAGIDLSDAVWHALGMRDNGPVRWRFIEGMSTHGPI